MVAKQADLAHRYSLKRDLRESEKAMKHLSVLTKHSEMSCSFVKQDWKPSTGLFCLLLIHLQSVMSLML